MLIQFSVANCLSFNEKTTLEFFASKDRNLKEQLWMSESRYIPNILKAAFIFGPNAGGKSNLIKAFYYAKSIVLGELNPLRNRTIYFKLCPDCSQKPIFFEFEMLIKRKIYRYGFEIKEGVISREWLWNINSTGEHKVYERTFDKLQKNKIGYGDNYKVLQQDEYFNFVLKGTPENKLFLTETINRNIELFRDVFEWFKKIVIIYPHSKLQSFNVLINNEFLLQEYRKLMKLCDLGIDDINIEKIEADEVLNKLPSAVRDNLRMDLPGNITLKTDERYSMNFKNGIQEAYRILISHKIPATESKIEFKINEESDGTNRIFDLIPVLQLLQEDAIVLVDELDRSLHPLVSRAFIKALFAANKQHQGQFIVTTHDATLLDVKLLRRDLIWFIRKNYKMESTLYSLQEFEQVRNDKALQKAYLAGLYGAIPIIADEDEE
ncbi:MAG TPA: ATP-binding protein [Candidatus Cloacimonas sp.]|nr:ATP-binding protein [Candidatus Cloacimonas sp.]